MLSTMTTPRKVDPRNLAGVAELAQLFDVGRTTVCNWYDRRQRNGFPEVTLRLASGPIWEIEGAVSWYASYVPSKGGRPGRLPTRNGERWVPATAGAGVQGV